MDLPEIRENVGRHLQKSDLAAAARVCKSWNASFIPFLYSTIRWKFKHRKGLKEGIIANVSHIRHLDLLLDPPTTFSDNCTNLRSLDVNTAKWSRLTDGWPLITMLVQNNPGIKSIKIEDDYRWVKFKVFFKVLPSCLELQVFDIKKDGLDLTCMEHIFDAAVRLERLALRGSVFEYNGPLHKWPCFPVLKELKLNIDISHQLQLEILHRCPQLRVLSWYMSNHGPIAITDACDIFKVYCPLVETLALVARFWLDEDFSQIVDSCRRLTTFLLFDCEFGRGPVVRTFRSLVRHFQSLRVLRLSGCKMTSKMIQQILTNCPNLTTFREGSLEACDILGITEDEGTAQLAEIQLQSQEWVCTNLRNLEVFICGLRDRPHEWHRRVFQQLARLTKLERLYLNSPASSVESRDGLDLRLETGLSALACLKHLKELKFKGLRQQMEEQDLKWMVEAWPKLRWLEGMVHHDSDRRSSLRLMLRQAGRSSIAWW
jgi:hypothetical protein